MKSTLAAFLAIIAMALITVVGDFFLKLASLPVKVNAKYFLMGSLIYGITAFGWVYAMRHLKLATLGVVFSVAMVLLMAALGVVAFKESLNRYEMVGIAFAVIALILLTRFSG